MHKPAGLLPAGIVDMKTVMYVSHYASRRTNSFMHTQARSRAIVKQSHGNVVRLFLNASVPAAGHHSPAARI